MWPRRMALGDNGDRLDNRALAVVAVAVAVAVATQLDALATQLDALATIFDTAWARVPEA